MKRCRVLCWALLSAAVAAAGVIFLVFVDSSSSYAATWKSLELRNLVFDHADLIVDGKIKAIEHATGRPDDTRERIAIIEIRTMLYGPVSTKTIRLRVDAVHNGLSYDTGDSGIWFLRHSSRTSGDAAGGGQERQALEVAEPKRPRVDAITPSTVFEAEHPSAFWPDDFEAFTRRNQIKGVRLTPTDQKERMRKLLSLVEHRLAADERVFATALKATQTNLEAIRDRIRGHS